MEISTQTYGYKQAADGETVSFCSNAPASPKWLKSYLKDSMENTGITKIECPFFKLSIQKNPASVEVFDENLIPDQFKEPVTTWKIDKNAIKEALKNGETVAGAVLLNGTRLSIK